MAKTIANLMVVIGARATALEKALHKQQKNLNKFSRTATAAGDTLMKTFTLPIVAGAGLAVKAAIDYESAFAGVRKTVNATEEELAALSRGIRDMSKEIPTAATDIARVAEAAGQLGIKTDSILGFTRVMVDLGETTNMVADEAATALARFANITQMPQSQFDRLGSTIVALGNNLATTESEIVEMGLRVAGAGKQVGMSEAEILAFSAALSSVGIEAQAGGSSISRLMIDMQLGVEKGGKSLDKFARVAGMSGKEFKIAFKHNAADAITAFIRGLSDAEKQGKTAIGILDDMGITEIRLRDALLRAAGAGNLFSDSLEIGTKAWEENNALTKEAEQRYGTFESKLKILKNRLTDVGIEVGGALIPALDDALVAAEPLFKATEDGAKKFDELSEAEQRSVIKKFALKAAIPVAIFALGNLAGAVANVLGLFEALVKIKAIGFAVSWLGPLGLVAAAVWGISEGIQAITRQTSGLNIGFGENSAIPTHIQDKLGSMPRDQLYNRDPLSPLYNESTLPSIGNTGFGGLSSIQGGNKTNVTININGNVSSEKDADYYGDMIVRKLRLKGVMP